MKYSLDILLSGTEGSVIRALGLIERRGYRLLTCQVSEANTDGQMMKVRVSSNRSADLLKRQLDRLHDVVRVELKSTSSRTLKNPGLRPISTSLSGQTDQKGESQ